MKDCSSLIIVYFQLNFFTKHDNYCAVTKKTYSFVKDANHAVSTLYTLHSLVYRLQSTVDCHFWLWILGMINSGNKWINTTIDNQHEAWAFHPVFYGVDSLSLSLSCWISNAEHWTLNGSGNKGAYKIQTTKHKIHNNNKQYIYTKELSCM